MPATDIDILTQPPRTNFHPLHRPPELPREPDPDEDDFSDVTLDLPAMIRAGEAPNAPRLCLEAGQQAKLRLLRFGEPARSLSLIGRHLVFQFGRLGCPKATDAALGGDRTRRCPLCAICKAGTYPRYLVPQLSLEVWAYALVLATDRGQGWVYTDPETLDRPHRVRFEGAARTSVFCADRNNPDLADRERGTDLLVIARTRDNWQLRLLDQTPLRLSTLPHVRERQLERIGRWLGEPHMWAERNPPKDGPPDCGDAYPVATEPELDAAAAHLQAHHGAPSRWNQRFWDELLSGSRPDWTPTPFV